MEAMFTGAYIVVRKRAVLIKDLLTAGGRVYLHNSAVTVLCTEEPAVNYLIIRYFQGSITCSLRDEELAQGTVCNAVPVYSKGVHPHTDRVIADIDVNIILVKLCEHRPSLCRRCQTLLECCKVLIICIPIPSVYVILLIYWIF